LGTETLILTCGPEKGTNVSGTNSTGISTGLCHDFATSSYGTNYTWFVCTKIHDHCSMVSAPKNMNFSSIITTLLPITFRHSSKSNRPFNENKTTTERSQQLCCNKQRLQCLHQAPVAY
jgi:hypothetical protein